MELRKRLSAFEKSFSRLPLYMGRSDHSGRDAQFEQFYHPRNPETFASFGNAFEEVAELNFELYEEDRVGSSWKA